MPMDIPKWLKEDMGLSDDAIAVVSPHFVPLAERIEKGYMRQADYSKNMDALRKSQTDLQAANDRLTQEMADWATAQASGKTITEKQAKDLESAQATVARLQARVTKIATDAGLDPAKALEGIDQVVAPTTTTTTTTTPDMSNYIDREAAGRLANLALTAPAEFDDIADEHFELTGKRLRRSEIVTEIQKRATTKGNQKSLEIRDVWEEMHDIPALRETAAKDRHDKEIAAAVERGRQEAISNMSIPGANLPQNTGGRPSPVLRTADGKQRESLIKRPQPGAGTLTAVNALRSHKYRPADPGVPAAK